MLRTLARRVGRRATVIWYRDLLRSFPASRDLLERGNPSLSLRENLAKLASSQSAALEIGPYFRPVLSGENVSYFDVLSTEELIQRANIEGYPTANIPRINFSSRTADLSVIDKTFKYVLSAHCIEHQPDLIQHLNNVARILDKDGRYLLIIPDKRYCFDHFLPPSTIADIEKAHEETRKVHTLQSVIDHRAHTTHNDTLRHWLGDHEDPSHKSSIPERRQAAVKEWEASNGGYVDVHAWQFTPQSFHAIIEQLSKSGLSPLEVESVFETPFPRNEFTAILRCR